jgi:hypothetical protein
MAGMFWGLIGDGFDLKIDVLGKYKGMKGMKDAYGRGASRGGAGKDAMDLASKTIAAVMVQALTGGAMELGLDVLFIAFPDGAKKGTRWRRSIDFKALMILDGRFELAYSVSSCSKTFASVAVGGLYRLSMKGLGVLDEGTVSGSAKFDVKNGRLLTSKLAARVKGEDMSETTAYELKFVESVPDSKAGRESFESKLKRGQELIERLLVKPLDGDTAAVHATAECKRTLFFACNGDMVRVMERRKSGEDEEFLRVISSLGREGWIRSSETTEIAKKD